MILRQPVLHARWKKDQLVTIRRLVRVRHTPILARTPNKREHHTTQTWARSHTQNPRHSRPQRACPTQNPISRQPPGNSLTGGSGGTGGLTGTGGLSGAYEYGYDYVDGPGGLVEDVTYPAAGGMLSENVKTDYNAYGLPTGVNGVFTDLAATGYTHTGGFTYDKFGRVTSRKSGTSPVFTRGFSYESGTGRLTSITTTLDATSGADTVAQDDRYAYDPAGNTVRIDHLADSQRECFRFDGRYRLTRGWTQATTSACTDPGTGTGTGPGAYNTAWSFDNVGNMLSVKEGGTTTAYNYPTPGAPRPHAVGSTSTSTGGEFVSVTPARLLDTRAASRAGKCPTQSSQCVTIPAGGTLTVQVAGEGGLPTTSVAAAALNMSAAS